MNDFPNDFQDVAKSGDSIKPLSSKNLMQNFAWARLQVDPTLLVDATSMGFAAKKLAIPAVPLSGTHVLGAVNGSLQWLSTEEC